MIHNKEFGCVIRSAKQKTKGRGSKINSVYCLTHKKYACRCGKEWGKHFHA